MLQGASKLDGSLKLCVFCWPKVVDEANKARVVSGLGLSEGIYIRHLYYGLAFIGRRGPVFGQQRGVSGGPFGRWTVLESILVFGVLPHGVI
jgi:hypothetical protein